MVPLFLGFALIMSKLRPWLLACISALAGPVHAQGTAVAPLERLRLAMEPEAGTAAAAGLFHPNARLVLDRELPLTAESLRRALDARHCPAYAWVIDPAEAAFMIGQRGMSTAELFRDLGETLLAVGCGGRDRQSEYDLYRVGVNGSQIGELRLVATVPIPLPFITPAAPGPPAPTLPPPETLPSSVLAVVGHIGALYGGRLEAAMQYLGEGVEVAVSDGTRTELELPPGRAAAHAMYLSMTNRGELALENFSCRPDGPLALCEVIFSRQGAQRRHFTVRFAAQGGPITRILSWEHHDR